MIYDWRKLKLKSCDQILCSGTGSLSKKIIWFNKLTGVKNEAAEISHVAMFTFITPSMAVTLDLPFVGEAVLESTTLNKFSGKEGVQVNPMNEWLNHYAGSVWVRKLCFERTLEFHSRYEDFMDVAINKPYESGIPGYLSLLLCGLRLNRFIPFYKPVNTREIHCSENNVEGTQYLDLCDDEAVSNRMPPSQFWEGGEFEKHLKVLIYEPLRIK